MIIGVPKEVKNHEYRVGATPAMVHMLCAQGHRVIVQSHAGTRIGLTDDQYKNAGATVVETAEEVYKAEMIIKVKEPQQEEFGLMQEGQILFSYLHLAPDPDQTRALLDKKIVTLGNIMVPGIM